MTINETAALIRADRQRNANNYKSQLITFLFRVANFFYFSKNSSKTMWIVGLPYLALYRIVVEWFLCVELPFGCKIGPGLIIDHGHALVVNKNTIIGSNCRLRNSTTIGCKVTDIGSQLPSPVIGNNVDVGSNVAIIGEIVIGNNVTIGAGAVVVKNLPDNCVAAGNPAKVIRNIP